MNTSVSSRTTRRRNVTPKKVKVEISWAAVCASIEKQSGLHGVSKVMMEMLWDIIHNPSSPANTNVKTQLILCMIPTTELVDSKLIENMIYSISNSNDKPGVEKIKLTLLKYLIGK